MSLPDSDFHEYRAHVLGRLLYTFPAGVPVEIEIEDADGNVLAATYLLNLALFTDADGKPVRAKIIGRATNIISVV